MSRLAVAARFVIGLCLVAVPLGAQDLRVLGDRLDREVAISRERRKAADDWRAERHRFKNATDSLVIANGAIKVVSTARAAVLARGAARIADSVLRQYPAVTGAIQGSVVTLDVDTLPCTGCDPHVVMRYISDQRSRGSRDVSEMQPDPISRLIEEISVSRALDRGPRGYFRWYRGNPPLRSDELETGIDWGAVRYDILWSRSLIGPRCYKGEIGACTMVLGLETVDDPVMTWYDSLARFDAVTDHVERARRFSRETTDRCLAGDDAACGRALHAINVYELPPSGGIPRDALMRQAILLGGEGAVDRLLTTKGSASGALAAAAGVPLDSIVKVWHGKLQEASIGSDDISPLMIVIAVGWVGLLFGLSTRISRWR